MGSDGNNIGSVRKVSFKDVHTEGATVTESFEDVKLGEGENYLSYGSNGIPNVWDSQHDIHLEDYRTTVHLIAVDDHTTEVSYVGTFSSNDVEAAKKSLQGIYSHQISAVEHMAIQEISAAKEL